MDESLVSPERDVRWSQGKNTAAIWKRHKRVYATHHLYHRKQVPSSKESMLAFHLGSNVSTWTRTKKGKAIYVGRYRYLSDREGSLQYLFRCGCSREA